eukprot:308561_1
MSLSHYTSEQSMLYSANSFHAKSTIHSTQNQSSMCGQLNRWISTQKQSTIQRKSNPPFSAKPIHSTQNQSLHLMMNNQPMDIHCEATDEHAHNINRWTHNINKWTPL